MMKKALILLLIFVFCLSTAYAEDSIWVKETWGQIDREVDCNGHPLLIHAKILEIPEKMEACQYFLDNPSYNFLIEKGDQIDWAALGCDTSNGKWRKPTKSDPEYEFRSELGFYPSCFVSACCDLQVRNYDLEYMNISWGKDGSNIDDIEVKGVSRETIIKYAETIARACGYQLGDAFRVYKQDDEKQLQENLMEAAEARGEKGASFDLKTAAGYAYTYVFYPIYYNGLRLYSGEGLGLENKREISSMKMQMAVTADHGIASIESALFDPDTLKAVTEPQPVISVEKILHRIEDRYAVSEDSSLEKVTVQKLTLEYVPISGPIFSEGGYTLYPAWVAKMLYETHDDPEWGTEADEFIIYEAYDAVTGEVIF